MERSKLFVQFSFVIVLPAAVSTAQQWQQASSIPRGSGVTALAAMQSSGHLYATTGSFDWPNGDTGGVHRSTDLGNTWTRVFQANIGRTVAVKSNGTVFASVRPTTNEGLYYSTNGGQTWTLTLDRGPNDNVFAVAFDTVSFLTPNIAYAGTRSGFGVHRNTAGGIAGSWTTSSQGLPIGAWILALAVAPLPPPALYGVVLAGVMNPFNGATSGVYYSTDQGQGWRFATGIQQGDTITSIVVAPDTSQSGNGRFVFAGSTAGRVYRAYVTSGASMAFSIVHAFESSRINAFSVVDFSPAASRAMHQAPQGNIFTLIAIAEGRIPFANAAAADSGGAFESIDYGISWQNQSLGIPPPLRMSSATILKQAGGSLTVFAGKFLNQNNGGPIFRRNFVVGDVTHTSTTPKEWFLNQNYPNPFNPSTTIEYDLPQRSQVEIRIFNSLGQLVRTLVNSQQDAGRHTIRWNGVSNEGGVVATGVYFYRLRSREFVQTKKLVFLR